MKSYCSTAWNRFADWARLIALAAFVGGAVPFIASAAENARPATNGFSFLDLTPFAIAMDEPAARSLSSLPEGRHIFHDVPFFVGRPAAVTGMESAARAGDFFPNAINGIKVGSAARRIHLLHGTMFVDKDGAPLANVVFHYSSGGTEKVRLGYGVQARAWIAPRLEKRGDLFDPNSEEAWTETDERRSSRLRLFQSALDNPRPGQTITSIDIVSLFSHAAPFFAAITVEGPESKLPANRPPSTRKPVRDLREFPDSSYRGELSVRVTDGETGGAATNAVATLAVTDDKESFFFGSTNVDAKGIAKFPYPPPHAVGIGIWIHAPGRLPVVVEESKTNIGKFTGNYAVTLKRGTTIGGIVKSANGQPIREAKINIHKVTRLSPHHYSRTDFDTTTTGSDGKWTTQSAPDDLTGFTFQVEHPDFRSMLYATVGYAPPYTNTSSSSTIVSSSANVTYRRLPDGTLEPLNRPARVTRPTVPLITSNALLSVSAEMILQPAILIVGTALDTEGHPLANREVIFQQNSPVSDRKNLRTDAKGKFRTMASAPGSGTINLFVEGHSPKFVMMNIVPDMPPVQIQLSPPLVLRGRVVDRQQRPVSGARVRLDEWQGTTDLVRFQTLTDESGTFVWTGAPSGQISFYTSKTNYNNSRHSFSGVTSNITITINRSPGIYGRVYDAETKKPVENFTVIPGRKYSTSETRVRWERAESVRGFGGEYSMRLSSYFFQPEARVLVEAPGYEPQISRAFQGLDGYTNDFALKRGKGINGIVQLPNGGAAVGAGLVLIEKNDSAYLDNISQVRGSGGNAEVVRSDVAGRFEFAPKLEPEKVFVSHEQGFAEATVAELKKSGKITLQPWGRIKGVVRVGDSLESGQTVRLQNNYEPVMNSDERSAYLSFNFKADADTNGNFTFDRVPVGEHRLAVEYRFSDERYETPISHGFLLKVKPGETTEASLGGNGRQVRGRVNLTGGTHEDVDWKRDVHRLTLVLPPVPGQAVNVRGAFPQGQEPLVFLGGLGGAVPAQPMNIEAMRERQRAERMYVLLFQTNGNFRVENVPPGKYQLMINVTDPDDEYYNRRSIGAVAQEVVVPDEKDAKVNASFDMGAVDLRIQPRLRIGRSVPDFEMKTRDGKAVKLSDHRGKFVLLHFWGLSLGYNTTELNALKELQSNYGASGKLVIIGCNLDADANGAQQFAQRQGFTWTQTYLGQWDQTPIPGMFGINGSSACVLVDAEGKLASGQFRGTAVRTMAMNALAGE